MSAGPGAPPRIVSLLPAATELVHALGLRDALVGRSHDCTWPESVRALPVCTRSLVVDGTGAAIDADVRRRAAAGEPLFEVDADRLRALAPTHVVTQAQCDVCAVGPEHVDAVVAGGWTGAPPTVLTLAATTLGDVFAELQVLGRALGVEAEGRRVATALAERVSTVGEGAGARTPRPRVLCLEWLDPPIAAGHWVPELVRIAGGEPLFGRVGQRSVDVTWDDVATADPDVIVLVPCGFDLERGRRDARALDAVPTWRSLRAPRAGRAFVVDGDAYFNRPGPRLVDSLELLAEILHPDAFDFGRSAHAAQAILPSGPPRSVLDEGLGGGVGRAAQARREGDGGSDGG